MRARQQEEKRAAAQATVDANLIPLGARRGADQGAAAGPSTPPQAIPEVEWWDARILVHPESYAAPAEADRYLVSSLCTEVYNIICQTVSHCSRISKWCSAYTCVIRTANKGSLGPPESCS